MEEVYLDWKVGSSVASIACRRNGHCVESALDVELSLELDDHKERDWNASTSQTLRRMNKMDVLFTKTESIK